MSKKILVVKHPSGIKRTVEFNKCAPLAEVFIAASKQFNLNQNMHELKLGHRTLNLRETIQGSRIPETAVLDIAPRTTFGNERAQFEVLVRMGFADEGYLYENCSKVLKTSNTLWDVIKCLVPRHMAYCDEDVCLTYLGVKYNGKERMKTVKLADLCGRERHLFFTCSRNYLRKPYNRTVKGDKRHGAGRRMKSRRNIAPEKKNICEITTEPSLGNTNPGVVELNERRGRLYHGGYISTSASGELRLHGDRSLYFTRGDAGGGKMLVGIVFPNVAVMEGMFSADETIRDVAHFVRKYFAEKAQEFYFYTVQPRLIVSPNGRLGNMKSSPPGVLWCCCKFKSQLFRKDIHSSLVGKAFSYVSSEIPEESKFDLRATSSMSWELSANQQQ